MSEMVRAVANNEKSANISMTNEHLVIKGQHFQLRDWYIRKSSDNVVIPVKDILSMEHIIMRSKRMLILFLLFSCLLVFGAKMLYQAVCYTQSMDSRIDQVEGIYNAVTSDNVDVSLTENLLDKVFGIRSVGLGVFCIILTAGSIVSFLGYAFRPYHFFRISAIGQMVAVERKYYSKEDLQNLQIKFNNLH